MIKTIRRWCIIIFIILCSIVSFDQQIGQYHLGRALNNTGNEKRIELQEKRKKQSVEFLKQQK